MALLKLYNLVLNDKKKRKIKLEELVGDRLAENRTNVHTTVWFTKFKYQSNNVLKVLA